jgi:hypothetical protein
MATSVSLPAKPLFYPQEHYDRRRQRGATWYTIQDHEYDRGLRDDSDAVTSGKTARGGGLSVIETRGEMKMKGKEGEGLGWGRRFGEREGGERMQSEEEEEEKYDELDEDQYITRTEWEDRAIPILPLLAPREPTLEDLLSHLEGEGVYATRDMYRLRGTEDEQPDLIIVSRDSYAFKVHRLMFCDR